MKMAARTGFQACCLMLSIIGIFYSYLLFKKKFLHLLDALKGNRSFPLNKHSNTKKNVLLYKSVTEAVETRGDKNLVRAFTYVNNQTKFLFQRSINNVGSSYWPLISERPLYTALAPSCSWMRNRRLYLATRSERHREPVLIWPAHVPTARSAMVVSSVSPER